MGKKWLSTPILDEGGLLYELKALGKKSGRHSNIVDANQ